VRAKQSSVKPPQRRRKTQKRRPVVGDRATIWPKDGNAPGRILGFLRRWKYTTVGRVNDSIAGVCYFDVEFIDEDAMVKIQALVCLLSAHSM